MNPNAQAKIASARSSSIIDGNMLILSIPRELSSYKKSRGLKNYHRNHASNGREASTGANRCMLGAYPFKARYLNSHEEIRFMSTIHYF
jgi:hypothetical protein